MDWTELKAEYASTDISYRKIAEKYEVSFNTLQKVAKSEGWTKARRNYRDKLAKKILQNLSSKMAYECTKKLIGLQKAADYLADEINSILKDPDQFKRYIIHIHNRKADESVSDVEERIFLKYDTKSIRDLAIALRELTTVIRNVYDIPTAQEKFYMDIAAQRLDLETRKVSLADELDNETGVILLPVAIEETARDEVIEYSK